MTTSGTDAMRIKLRACEQYGISLAEFMSRGRWTEYVAARRSAAHRMRIELGMTMQEIARELGFRDHTGVAYLLRRTKRARERASRRREGAMA